MTEGQHSHEELKQELEALKSQLSELSQQGSAVTQEATQAAVNAQQAAEVAVTESAVTRADLESLRDELKAAIAEVHTQAPKEPEIASESVSGPSEAIPDLVPPPETEEVLEGENQPSGDEAAPVEPKDKKNTPPKKRKSVWWG